MTGPLTRAYMALRVLAQPLMRRALRRRLARGKEDPARMGERLGQPTAPRPEGRVVWVHAVGLGEVLALRPLIQAMQAEAPDLSFVITSVARSSAQVIAGNLPPRCTHQFLPLDGRDFVAAFLDHWRPALSVWSEQDLWPGAIHDCAARGIPLAYVNARMNAASLRRRRRVAGLYRDVLARFALVAAQDEETAASLRSLGADPVVTGSLKPAAAPLAAEAADVDRLSAALQGRRVWVAASTHAADEAVLIPAQVALWQADPAWLMILAPRLPQRGDDIAAALMAAGLPFARRSAGQVPGWVRGWGTRSGWPTVSARWACGIGWQSAPSSADRTAALAVITRGSRWSWACPCCTAPTRRTSPPIMPRWTPRGWRCWSRQTPLPLPRPSRPRPPTVPRAPRRWCRTPARGCSPWRRGCWR